MAETTYNKINECPFLDFVNPGRWCPPETPVDVRPDGSIGVDDGRGGVLLRSEEVTREVLEWLRKEGLLPEEE